MLNTENLLITFFGILTVLIFVLMVTVGGIFESPYSLFFKEVSYTISPYSPAKGWTIPLYVCYNISLLLFSAFLTIRLRNLYGKFGAIYLFIAAVLGLILVFYPMDPRGISGSAQGVAHIAVVLIISLYSIIAIYLLAYAFKRSKNLANLSNFSLWVCSIILFAGLFTGFSALLSIRILVGLVEKIPIAAFLVWLLATALAMLHSDHRIKKLF